jgi:hypothetical protein
MPPRLCQTAVDDLRFQAIEELSALAASYWASIGEAAYRRELPVLKMHCRQIALVSREAFNVAKAIGSPPDQGGGAA